MPGLVPGTHVFLTVARSHFKTWMTGTPPERPARAGRPGAVKGVIGSALK